MELKINKKQVIKKILKDCFWDYALKNKDIEQIISSNDEHKKRWLFLRILKKSTDKLQALLIFDKANLKKLFESLDNEEFPAVDTLILRNILFGENNKINRLAWKKR